MKMFGTLLLVYWQRIIDLLKTLRTSEMWIDIHQSTCWNIPEDLTFHYHGSMTQRNNFFFCPTVKEFWFIIGGLQVLKLVCGVTVWNYTGGDQMREVIRDNWGIISSTYQCQHCLRNKWCEIVEIGEQNT